MGIIAICNIFITKINHFLPSCTILDTILVEISTPQHKRRGGRGLKIHPIVGATEVNKLLKNRNNLRPLQLRKNGRQGWIKITIYIVTWTDFSAPWHLHQATALGVLVWLLLSDTWVDLSQSLAIL